MATDRPIRTQRPGVIGWIAQRVQAGFARFIAASPPSARTKRQDDPQKVFRRFVRLIGRLRADGAQPARPAPRAGE